MKKTVKFYIDVDGVILDYNAGFREMIRQTHPEFYDPELHSGNIAKNLYSKKIIPNVQKIIDEYMASDYFSELPLLSGLDHILKMYTLGEVTFVTNIPYHSIDNRMKNLKKRGLPETKLIAAGIETYGEKSYPIKSQSIREISQDWHTSFFLDDMTANYDDIKTNFPHFHCFLLRGIENQDMGLGNYSVADNFENFVDSAEKIILKS